MPTFVYSQEMDHLILKNNIADSEEEEPRSPTNPEKGMIDTNDEEETTPIGRKCARDEMTNTNQEGPTMPWVTQRLEIGSTDMNTTPPKIGFVQ